MLLTHKVNLTAECGIPVKILVNKVQVNGSDSSQQAWMGINRYRCKKHSTSFLPVFLQEYRKIFS